MGSFVKLTIFGVKKTVYVDPATVVAIEGEESEQLCRIHCAGLTTSFLVDGNCSVIMKKIDPPTGPPLKTYPSDLPE